MSDFGTEMGNSGLTLMGKLLDALMKLISKIYDTIRDRTSVEYKLKKAEYGEMKSKESRRKFLEKIEGKTGYVRHRDLERAGVPLTVTGITIDEKGFRELAARCKREGIVISAIEDARDRSMQGKRTMIVECKQSDLERLAKLIDLMNDEKKIEKINAEIEKLQTENRTFEAEQAVLLNKHELSSEEQERLDKINTIVKENQLVIGGLTEQIDEIRNGHCQELNQEQATSVVEKVVNGETQRGISFNEAVDRWTGGAIDKDTVCYVVDAKDPNKYIVCTAKNDRYKDQDYIKTTYEVYNGSKQVYATHDGRFDGRPKDYWFREKAAMRDKGEFGDQVIKFYSIKELEAYRANYKAQNAEELDLLDVGKDGRDYSKIVQALEVQLEECGGEYRDGVTIQKETDKPFILSNDMSNADRANAAEAVVIGKQIANYEDLSKLESEMALARAELLTTDENSKEYVVVQENYADVQHRYAAALDTEKALIEERKSVNAVQAEQEVQNADLEMEQDVAGRTGAEKVDDRRDERVDEVRADKEMTMEEYQQEINEQRQSATETMRKDGTAKEKAKQKNPVPKSHDER